MNLINSQGITTSKSRENFHFDSQKVQKGSKLRLNDGNGLLSTTSINNNATIKLSLYENFKGSNDNNIEINSKYDNFDNENVKKKHNQRMLKSNKVDKRYLNNNNGYNQYNSTRDLLNENKLNNKKKETFYLTNRLKNGKQSLNANKTKQNSNSKDKLLSLDSTMKSKRFFHSEVISHQENMLERESITKTSNVVNYKSNLANPSNPYSIKISSVLTPKVALLGRGDLINNLCGSANTIDNMNRAMTSKNAKGTDIIDALNNYPKSNGLGNGIDRLDICSSKNSQSNKIRASDSSKKINLGQDLIDIDNPKIFQGQNSTSINKDCNQLANNGSRDSLEVKVSRLNNNISKKMNLKNTPSKKLEKCTDRYQASASNMNLGILNMANLHNNTNRASEKSNAKSSKQKLLNIDNDKIVHHQPNSSINSKEGSRDKLADFKTKLFGGSLSRNSSKDTKLKVSQTSGVNVNCQNIKGTQQLQQKLKSKFITFRNSHRQPLINGSGNVWSNNYNSKNIKFTPNKCDEKSTGSCNNLIGRGSYKDEKINEFKQKYLCNNKNLRSSADCNKKQNCFIRNSNNSDINIHQSSLSRESNNISKEKINKSRDSVDRFVNGSGRQSAITTNDNKKGGLIKPNYFASQRPNVLKNKPPRNTRKSARYSGQGGEQATGVSIR